MSKEAKANTLDATFINGRKKGEVITDLIQNQSMDYPAAELWWKANGVGTSAIGFIAKLDESLIAGRMDEKAVLAFIAEHGTANTMRSKSYYIARAKFADELRDSLGK